MGSNLGDPSSCVSHPVPSDSLSLIRRRNALRLFREFADAYRASADEAMVAAAEQGDVADEAKRRPMGVEAAFAERLQIKASSWSMARNGTRPIGDKLARQVEACCGRPSGWLDEDRAEGEMTEGEARFVALALQAYRSTNADGRKRLRHLIKSFGQ